MTAALVAQLPSLPPWHVGYAPGGRMADVVSLVRTALFNAAAWSDPAFGCVVLSCDVRRAFDNVEYDVAAQALLCTGVPGCSGRWRRAVAPPRGRLRQLIKTILQISVILKHN